MILSNQPYKGTADWLPQEYAVRKRIFDSWRLVCHHFGYKEYLTPLVEPIELYKAKSGEDLGGKELMRIVDRAGRELAIRPEMTPSVTRMVTQIYESESKPIRLFSIANFMRAEKPQKGRNREFWQLNFDIFGSESLKADVEILQIALEIMLSFNPPEGSFVMLINNRLLMDALYKILGVDSDGRTEVTRILDKWNKESNETLRSRLESVGLSDDQINTLNLYMSSNDADSLLRNLPALGESQGYKDTVQIMSDLETLGYKPWIKFQPNVIRGLDYYDGMVFEVFDTKEGNNRSLFGGGRYNGLASLFGSDDIPAVGCAPGDETLRIFLEGWGLLESVMSKEESRVYIPLLDDKLFPQQQIVATALRAGGKVVTVGLQTERVGKALQYADKNSYDQVILIGDQEVERGVYTLKDLKSGEQSEVAYKY